MIPESYPSRSKWLCSKLLLKCYSCWCLLAPNQRLKSNMPVWDEHIAKMVCKRAEFAEDQKTHEANDRWRAWSQCQRIQRRMQDYSSWLMWYYVPLWSFMCIVCRACVRKWFSTESCMKTLNFPSLKLVCAMLRPLPSKLRHLPLKNVGFWQNRKLIMPYAIAYPAHWKSGYLTTHPPTAGASAGYCMRRSCKCLQERSGLCRVVSGGVIRSHQGLPAMMGIQPGNKTGTQ